MTTQNTKPEKRPVAYSAGIGGLSLIPREESVALVLNIAGKEVQLVPKNIATQRREFQNRILRDAEDGENVIVEFDQPDGYGTMFGKVEDEDENDPVKTALREALEESGMDFTNRVIPTVFHREQPREWSPYYNITFLGNCIGTKFRNDLIQDDFVDKTHSGFFYLFALPLRPKKLQDKKNAKKKKQTKSEFHPGMYQAAVRRTTAILLQLDRPLLTELGRPNCDSADDLVRMVLARIRYTNLFSSRMLKMLVGLKREDIILERLRHDKGVLHDGNLHIARHIGSNLVLWLPRGEILDKGLDAFLSRCDREIRHTMEIFLGERLIRRKSTIAVYEDKHAVTPDDKEVVEEENEFTAPEGHLPDYARPAFARQWMQAEAEEITWKKKRQAGRGPA